MSWGFRLKFSVDSLKILITANIAEKLVYFPQSRVLKKASFGIFK